MNEIQADRVSRLTAALRRVDLSKVASWGEIIADRLRHGGRVLVVGNGGSAAQAQHLVAELVGRFESERDPLAALALSADSAVVTALGNDYGAEQLFARQVRAHGRDGDVLVAISTSGHSANVITAATQAKALGMLTLALTGPAGSTLARICDEAVTVQASAISTIQECHLLITHELCAAVDQRMLSPTPSTPPENKRTDMAAAIADTRRRRVVVVGDTLCDCDWTGEVNRVSPEAPVPVLSAVSRVWSPGGAGLAATLAAADGCTVTLVTAIGHDEPGQRIRADLAAAGVELIELPTPDPTPMKIRLRAREQTMMMIDDCALPSPTGEPPPEAATALAEADGVLVADYGRGVATQPRLRALLVSAARRIPVIWDPHRRGPAPVHHVSVVVPNHEEAAQLDGAATASGTIEDDIRRARNLRSRWRCQQVVVTRGGDGAVLVGSDTGPAQIFAPPRREYGDSRGAGDRFAVTLLEELIRTRVVSRSVQRAVAHAAEYVAGHHISDQRRGHDTVRGSDGVALAERVRLTGGRVVATGGCFDILHDGHRRLLQAASAMGDCLLVLINSDASVARLKGPNRPLIPQDQRAALLEAFGCVDAVLIFDEDTPTELLDRIRPHLWVKGGDYEGTDLPETAIVERHGGQVVCGPYTDGVSTSELLARAAAGQTVQS
jgi:rfaE bifunctional protein nucleotidyltransferase chain/domain/rfaE bifunctional protein kinase chain/domain